ncbi:MAG: YCF48-related protein [Ignavibacteria bacterium]|nr:YCF48-related protein [Ignavibacteria bacterium]
MKASKIILLILFSFSIGYSQSGWILQNSGTYENLNGVFFATNNPTDYTKGWIVGDAGKIMATTNSGVNWYSLPAPIGFNFNCVFFVNPQVGFIGCQNGKLYRTTNGGYNWTMIDVTANNYAITSIMFTPLGAGWMGNYYGNVIKSTDWGLNWYNVYTVPGYNSKVFCLDEYRTWVVDTYGYVFRTSNSGSNFSYSRPVTSPLRAVYFITSNIGFVAGDSGKILKTTNGGVNFVQVYTGTYERINSIYAINPFNLWAVGDNGTMLKSTNGGESWVQYYYTTNNLKQVYFIPNTNYGYCVGDLGTILRTNEAPGIGGVGSGNQITAIPFNTQFSDGRTNLLYLASEINSIIGASAANIFTIGFNFESVNTQTINGLKIKMRNTTQSSLTGYTSTGWTTVFDGNWAPSATGVQFIPLQNQFIWSYPNSLLIEICFNNSVGSTNSTVYSSNTGTNTVYHNANNISGDGCVDITGGTASSIRPNLQFMWYPVTTEVTKKSTEIPKNFVLYQNYPNPFNPTTKISYDIPKSGFVIIKIFDILGREISKLVNSYQEPGNYIIEYDASDLPAGLYFYRLDCDGFTDTKKMIIIK